MIAILTPYGRNEVTAAAIRLADLCISLGDSVKLIACNIKETNIHPYWDSKVYSGEHDKLYNLAKDCNCFVYFIHNPGLLAMTNLVTNKAKHILVFSWHSMRPSEVSESKYDLIVCPSQGCFDYVFKTNKLNKCTWTSGLLNIKREGRLRDEKLSACMYLDKSIIEKHSLEIFSLIDAILGAVPSLNITCLHTKSFNRRDRNNLKTLLPRLGNRLKVSLCNNLISQIIAFHNHDWVLFPGIFSNFGMVVDTAIACGAKVICHEIDPLDEHVFNNENGILIPCEVKYYPPIASFDLNIWKEVCTNALGSVYRLLDLQTSTLSKTRDNEFNNFWLKLFNSTGN